MVYKGTFFDGQHAVSHTLSLHIEDKHYLVGYDIKDNQYVFTWDLEALIVHEKPLDQRPASIGIHGSEARLLLDEDTFAAIIPSACGKLRTLWFHPQSLKHIGIWATALIVVILAVVLFLPSIMASFAPYIPSSVEQKLGEYSLSSLQASAKTCSDEKGVEALDALVAQLQQADEELPNAIMHVFDHEMVNAFALPDDHIVIFSGLLEKLDSPEALAGVIAHEMGHLYYSHPLEVWLRRMGSIAVLTVLLGGDPYSSIVLIQTLSDLYYSRDAERQADAYAMELLNKAAISPDGLIRFFSYLKESEPSIMSVPLISYFSSHPRLGDRLDDAQKHQAFPGKNKGLLAEDEWKNLQHICSDIDK